MARRGTFAAIGLLCWLLVGSGCAGLEAPLLAVDNVRIGRAGLTHVPVDVVFRVRNPNPEPLDVERFEYELFLNGRRIGRGFEPRGMQLRGFGEGRVRTRLEINTLALPGAVKDLLDEDHVRARARGRFYTRGTFGQKRLGFDTDAEVDLRGER